MKKYAIKVTEKLTRTVIVEMKDNESLEDAIEKVEAAHHDGEIILDSDDYDGEAEFEASSTWEDGLVPENENVDHYWHLNGM